jgi:hypothetical protein
MLGIEFCRASKVLGLVVNCSAHTGRGDFYWLSFPGLHPGLSHYGLIARTWPDYFNHTTEEDSDGVRNQVGRIEG